MIQRADVVLRVAHRLDVNGLRLVVDGSIEGSGVVGRNPFDADTEFLEQDCGPYIRSSSA